MEIERKWLIDREKLPYRLEELKKKKIEQSYVSFSPVIRVRNINDGEKYVLTVKSSEAGLAREEFELPLTKEQYAFLFAKHEGTVIQKTRYLKEENGLMLEIDLFEGDLSGLSYLEIEFPDRESAEVYPTPGFAVADVSDRAEFANANLSRFGKPQETF